MLKPLQSHAQKLSISFKSSGLASALSLRVDRIHAWLFLKELFQCHMHSWAFPQILLLMTSWRSSVKKPHNKLPSLMLNLCQRAGIPNSLLVHLFDHVLVTTSLTSSPHLLLVACMHCTQILLKQKPLCRALLQQPRNMADSQKQQPRSGPRQVFQVQQ